jgi:CubicO group peptidase (beta-lactamase class C family)
MSNAAFHDTMAAHVESASMPGLIALVAHDGHVDVEVIGTRTFDDARPLERDAIFRIASLSKPIAAAVAMMLVDDGTLRLDEPVDRLLPELADRRVLRTIGSVLDDTVPAQRPITVEDVLSFRLGFGCIMAPPDTYPIQTAEVDLQLMTLGPPWPPTSAGNDEWIRRLGTLPLMEQPGAQWRYNTGAQVLGVLLERAAGRPLEAVLRERLFDPLGMVDTSFFVPAGKRDRFTTAYAPDPESGELHVLDRNDETSWWAQPPAMPNAAGWLVSTIDDYWAFASMMAAGGVHRGERLISEESFRALTTDRLTPAQREGATLFLGEGGWGLGMGTPADGRGGFGWEGGTGTTWRTDPARGLTGILFTQRAMTSPEGPTVFTDFWAAADDLAGLPAR